MNTIGLLLLLLGFSSAAIAPVRGAQAWRPCAELNAALRLPCRCRIEQYGSGGVGVGGSTAPSSIAMDCDRVVFHGENPPIPHGTPVITFTQRHSGQQFIPAQSFGAARIPIRSLDYSHNVIRRLSDKLFAGLHETLIVLRLSDNLLGDSLNPIFSTAELHPLGQLKVLDLGGNKLRAIEEGLLKGCEQLQELYLDRNSFLDVPAKSLNGPRALRILSMQHNSVVHLNGDQFATQRQLERIDLRHNLISLIDGGAFRGLSRIKEILLAGNRLAKFNSDVFQGAGTLQKLDLSQNFISIFPNIALRSIEHVKVLNLSANMIQQVGAANFEDVRGLQILDLSRNNIASVPPATFRGLKALKYLDLSLNSLRTIEDDALEGLDSLQTLIIRDNNILLIPGSALGRLPRLANLYLDFNRVAALSADILGSIQPEDIKYMSLSRNVIRELPTDSFQKFANLIYLDLSGNSLANVNADTFGGLEQSLRELRLAQNRLTSIGQVPLGLNELKFLDLSENNIGDLPRNIFRGLDQLVSLNLSGNSHMGSVPASLLHPLEKLRVLDLSDTGMKVLSDELFANSAALETVRLSHNALQEIREASFANLRNISTIDMSYNSINSIRSSAFINLMNIKHLNLRGNQLSIFKGEYFNTGTGLEVLDISDNDLSYLFPSSFRIHPRLRRIEAANNKFTFFPAELIAALQFLEHIDLSGNLLKIVDELDFARLPHLSTLLVARNELETLNEMAFHNSSQLQRIDLSHNRLDRIGERTFEGLVRIELLNLEGNRLSELPDSIFERNKLQSLENINLANNRFEVAPLRSLQKQFFFVSAVDLSHNQIRHLPVEDSAIVNIKKLDLSYNPLTADSLRSILGEPKTIRELNLAGTGLRQITALETPFLQVLNVSHNEIVEVNENSFSRTTLLETLDLSGNRLVDMRSLAKVWPKLAALQRLDISNNSLELIAQGDFDGLEMLRSLSLTTLPQCGRIERNAFKNLPALSQLRAYDFPKLGYLDVQGIVELLPALEVLDIEIKDAVVGSDQIQIQKHPRLQELGIRGGRLRSISSGTLAGLKTGSLQIRLLNTSVSSLPPALLFPIPRSAQLDLDISHSAITVLSPQLLAALDDRRTGLRLRGLNSNPIACDCNARALRRWLPGSGMAELKCSAPDWLAGKLLIEVADDELTCDAQKPTARRESPTLAAAAIGATDLAAKQSVQTPVIVPTKMSATSKFVRSTTVEPEIIWSMPPTPVKIKTKAPLMKAHPVMTNDDTLIIGIVAGVVAFIIIIVIIFCIVRLRMSNDEFHGGRGHPGMAGRMPPNGMGYGKGGAAAAANAAAAAASTIYAVPPYAQSYATLQTKGAVGLGHQQQLHHHQSQQSLAQLRQQYATLGRMPYYQQAQQQQQQQQQHQQQHQQQQHQQQHQHSANGQPYIIYGDDKSYR